MQKKITVWKTKGMNRDLSVSAFNPEFSFENRNLRLSTNDGNTMLSWVNEKGTQELDVDIIINAWASAGDNSVQTEGVVGGSPRRPVRRRRENNIIGTPIGKAILNDQLVLFTTTSTGTDEQPASNTNAVQKHDFIYVLKYVDSNNKIEGFLLYNGNLNFNPNYPLETIVSYEAEYIQKVYWTDGYNQPRIVNIKADDEHLMLWNTTSGTNIDTFFDFVPSLSLQEDVTITKAAESEGLFAPGIIQYCFSYINKYSQQSNLAYVSPLYYLSHKDRGASPEEKVTNSFKITIDNIDHNFDYIRLYSIQRTSLNANPIVKLVQDIKLPPQYYVDLVYAEEGEDLTIPLERVVETEEGQEPTVEFKGIKGAEIDGKDFFEVISPITLGEDIAAEWENSESISFTAYNETTETQEEASITMTDLIKELLNNVSLYSNSYTLDRFYAILTIDNNVNNFLQAMAQPQSQSQDTYGWGLTVGNTFYPGKDLFYDGTERTAKNLSFVYNYNNSTWYIVDSIDKIQVPDVENTVSFIDNGTTGSTVDSYELLYIGGHEITALTMAEKDNTLFLGNINQPSSNVLSIQDYFDSIRDTENECTISFDYLPEKVSQGNIVKGVYDYKHALDEGNSYNITTFKGGDTYRFGIQFQKATGEWSMPIFLNDVKNTLYPKTYYSRDGYSLIGAKATINIEDMLANIQSSIPDFIEKYKKVRPVIVYPNYADRTVLCQGVVNPTVFNIRDRIEKGVFSQSSWFYRPYCNGDNTRQDQTVGDRSTVWSYGPYWGEPVATGTKYFTIVQVPYLSYITYGDKFSIKISGTYTKYRDPISFGPEYIDFDSAIYLGKASDSDNEYYALVSDKSFSTLMKEKEDYYYYRVGQPPNWKWNPVVEAGVVVEYYSVIGAAIDANLHVNPISHLYYYDSPSVEPTEEPQTLDLVFYTPVEGAQFSNWKHIVTFTDTTEASTSISDGTAVEYAHYSFLSSNPDNFAITHNAEIMCAPGSANKIPIYTEDAIDLSEENSNSDFYVDQSIVTLNSPDLEFGEDLQWYSQNNLKLRIVGIIPITANSSKYNIETSSPMMELYHNVNFKMDDPDKNKIEHFTGKGNISDIKTVSNIGIYAGRRLCSDYLWDDVFTTWKDIDSKDTENKDNICNRGFVVYGVYPWHRDGSLNNDFRNKANASSWLGTKVLSNLYYSYNTEYFSSTNSGNTVSNVDFSNIDCKCHLYDNTQVYNIRLSGQGEDLSQIDYYPNIDKVLYNKDGYLLSMALSYTNPKPRFVQTRLAPYTELELEQDSASIWVEFSRYNNPYDGKYAYDKQFSVYSPVSMKYKSGTHAIISFRKDSNNNIPILPYGSVKVNNHIYNLGKYTHTGNIYDTSWGDKNVRFTQEGINVFDLENKRTDFLWLAELYQDIDDSVRFGGRSIQALQENKWLPCGESVALQDSEGSIKDEVTLKWLQGDTYYQRYDSLKTVPFTKEDQNQIVEILSFMCETRYNICGRYDANRGQLDNSVMTPENFNKLNPVYSQANNFFTYKIIETEDEDKSSYPNSITYTKTKTAGATEDLYTNITLASMLEMDGDKGKVNSIVRLNDTLISFQDTGIAQILYNENVQINSTQGVPIEIANSGKVQGKRYLSDTVGCSNKWSIVTTPQGVYFFDSVSKDIYAFDGQLTNVSLNKGLHSWVFNSIPADVWNPATFTGCVSYYDPINQEVLFITSTSCISYSLKLQEFTSFYDYYNAPYLCTVKDKNLWVSKSRASQSSLYKMWRHNAGDYCNFFGVPAPYSVTLIGNPDPQMDKIFTNMEMRVIVEGDGEYNETEDTFTPTLPFSSLETWNDYQHGIANLVTSNGMRHHTPDRNGSLLRKFRMWRCDIPRDNVDVNAVTENPMGIFRKAKHPLDRMRNPWLYLKLKKDAQVNMPKVELHDFLMTYFE